MSAKKCPPGYKLTACVNPMKEHNNYLDGLIAAVQPELRFNENVIKDLKSTNKQMKEIGDDVKGYDIETLEKKQYRVNTKILASLFDKVRSFYDLLFMNYAFLTDKLDGTPYYTGRFGEGDGKDHIVAGAGLRTMTVYGLLTTNGQSNSSDKIELPESPFLGQFYDEYSYVEFITTKAISDKLFALLKDKHDLFISVRSGSGLVYSNTKELIHSSVHKGDVNPNLGLSDLTIYNENHPVLAEFHPSNITRVNQLTRDMYQWVVGINPFRPRNSRLLAPVSQLQNVELIINKALTDPLNGFKHVLIL